MLITKFNRMVTNKIVWAIFALLVSILFVAVGYVGGRGASRAARNGEGRIGEHEVSPEDFRLARFFEMGMRDAGDRTPEMQENLRRRAWIRIAMLREAERMNLKTTDAEIRDVIQRDPSFQEKGRFSPALYRRVIAAQLHVDVTVFERYLREQLTIQKLRGAMGALAWTSPAEMNRSLHNLTDDFRVQYSELMARDFTNGITMTEAQAREYYAAHTNDFIQPEQRRVRYVAFPVNQYTSGVAVTEEEIRAYHEEHRDEFPAPTNAPAAATSLAAGTNAPAPAAAGTNAAPAGTNAAVDLNAPAAGTNVNVMAGPTPEQQETIRARMLRDRAENKAKDAATELVIQLAPDRAGRATSFDEAVRGRGLQVSTTGLFTATGEVPGLRVGPDFNHSAFQLEPDDPERYFSDAIPGEDAVYVLASLEVLPAHVPSFDRIRQDVTRVAFSNEVAKVFTDKVKAIREKAAADVASGKGFKEAMQVQGLNVSTTGTFNVYMGMSSTNVVPHASVLFPSIARLSQGEITPPLPIPDGALIAYVAAREPGDPATMQFLTAQLRNALDRNLSDMVFETWGESLLKKDFIDRALSYDTNAVENAEQPSDDHSQDLL